MKLKIPKLTIKRPGFLTRKPEKTKSTKLQAATARVRPLDDDFDDEPQTRLSSAFFVVLILHVVAVGGIYAFNSIKAHRKGLEPSAAAAKSMVEKAAVAAPAAAPVKPHVGQGQDLGPKSAPAPAAPAQLATTPVSGAKVYRVKEGDTLSRIAQQTGVSVVALQFANTETTTLRPGQVLNVPARTAAAAPVPAIEPPAANPGAKKTDASVTKKTASSAAATGYEVQRNDTATSIAKRFNVTVDDLLKLNKISDPKKLQLGQKLSIPAKKN